MNAQIISQYQEARQNVTVAFQQHGSRSQQYYDAMTILLAAEREVERQGRQREAGIIYDNVYD